MYKKVARFKEIFVSIKMEECRLVGLCTMFISNYTKKIINLGHL